MIFDQCCNRDPSSASLRRVCLNHGRSLLVCLPILLSFASDHPASARQPGIAGMISIDPHISLTDFEPEKDFAMPGQRIPMAAYRELFKSTDGALHVGVWEGGPGVLKLKDYPFDEYSQLVSGYLVITDMSGHRTVYRKGDSYVIPKGFSGVWEMKTSVRKQYVTGPQS